MNAKFEIAQHKLINHALHCLSRFGETLSILCSRHGEKDHVVSIKSMATITNRSLLTQSNISLSFSFIRCVYLVLHLVNLHFVLL